MLQFHVKSLMTANAHLSTRVKIAHIYSQKKHSLIRIAHFFLSKAIFFSCRQQTVSITVIAMKTAFPLSNLNRPSNDTISHYWKRCLVIKKDVDIQQLFLDHAYMPYVAISQSVCLCVDLPKIYQLDKLTE